MASRRVEGYFENHHIAVVPELYRNDTWYETETGICFILDAGEKRDSHAYTVRHLPPKVLADGRELRWENAAEITTGAFCYTPWDEDWENTQDKSRVFIVEGPTDALRLWSAGYLSVSTLGVTLNEGRSEFIYQLVIDLAAEFKEEPTMVLIPDNDGPGVKLERNARLIFPGLEVLRLPTNRKDISEVDDEELECLLQKT